MITHAFTCTGPYAVLVMLGIKRVENRGCRPSAEKGRCAVSCSKSFCAAEYGNFLQWASQCLPAEDFARVPAWADVKDWPGRMVGTCEVCVRSRGTRDPTGVEPVRAWDEGFEYWWELSDVACFDRPIPCRGNVGMWPMGDALAARPESAPYPVKHPCCDNLEFMADECNPVLVGGQRNLQLRLTEVLGRQT